MRPSVEDPQALDVYDAEEAVFMQGRSFIRRFPTMYDVERYIGHVVRSDWWASLESPEFVDIEYITAAGFAAEATREGEHGRILLPRWAWNRPIILHELTHLVTWRGQAHGPRFAYRRLEAEELFGSIRDARRLQQTFDEYGVRYS